MDNELHFVNEEELEEVEEVEEKEPVQVEGVPYVDEYGVEHDDLVYYKADNGCKIYCPQDDSLYDDAVVRADSDAEFFETDEPIEVVTDENAEGDDEDADS